ncbi:Copia protein, partial [Mucuna pruriens]
MDRLRAFINSTSKSLGSCGFTMKVSKEQLITVANGDHVPIGESYLEVESIIESLRFPTKVLIESLPVPTQDVQEVTKPTLVLENLEEVYMEIPTGFYSHNEKNKELGKLKYFLGIEVAYSKQDYAESVVDRRFILGYCMFMGENLVTWRSKKQNVVTRSSVEAEFRVMAHNIYKGLWMKIILDDLKVKYEGPIKLFCDIFYCA